MAAALYQQAASLGQAAARASAIARTVDPAQAASLQRTASVLVVAAAHCSDAARSLAAASGEGQAYVARTVGPHSNHAQTEGRANAGLATPQDGAKDQPAEIDRALLGANPHFSEDAPRYSANCIHCVQAYELRRRGQNVVASALPDRYLPTMGRPLSDLTAVWGGSFIKGTRREIESTVRGWGAGGRGVVYMSALDGSGHVFNVESLDSGIRFVDGQNGNADAASYFDYAVTSAVMRIDNLEPSQLVREFVDPGV
jgi:hypothetical protein